MIQFACPGCGATYTVTDEKAGKTGKCPKCQSQFLIPDAPAGVPPDAGTVEVAPCPGCQARLTVAVTDLGADIECPHCKTVYTAARPGAAPPPSRKSARDEDRPRRRDDDDEDDRPRRRRRDEDDDDEDHPRRKREEARRDDEGDEDRPRRKRDEDDDEEARPRKKPKKARARFRSGKPFAVRRLSPLGFGAAHTAYMLSVLAVSVVVVFFYVLFEMIAAGVKFNAVGQMAGGGPGGDAADALWALFKVLFKAVTLTSLVGFLGGALFAVVYNLISPFVAIEMDLDG